MRLANLIDRLIEIQNSDDVRAYPDTDIRVSDLNGRVLKVFSAELDGNGYVYIDTAP